MLHVYPAYYPSFRCAADRCRHTCCAGWEVDIDAETLETYRAVPGGLGKRLADAVDTDGEAPHFRLTAGERCPFLTERNLCDLILAGGEELLCQICRDHPRFRSFLPGRTETGLGLCCEAAAALILSQKEPIPLLCEGVEDPEDEWAEAILLLRDGIMSTIWNRSLSLDERMERILSACGARLPDRAAADWAALFLRLERLDDAWTSVLNALRSNGDLVDIKFFCSHMADRESEYEQLLAYFLFRHFLKAYDDGDIGSKAAFAVLSTRLLRTIGAVHFAEHGSFTFADQVEYARMYSAEIEYSEDNLDALFDELCGADGET